MVILDESSPLTEEQYKELLSRPKKDYGACFWHKEKRKEGISMIQHEKIKKGLKICVRREKKNCLQCPYDSESESPVECQAALMKDVAKLITRLQLENFVLKSGKSAKPLRYWAEQIHKNAVEHGWWDEDRSFGEIVALCHSELSEALEEYRAGRDMVWYACEESEDSPHPCDPQDEYECRAFGFEAGCVHRGKKPEGIAVEMIDCIIRILDWCCKEGVDVDAILAAKHEYNKGRPYRHGGKKL